MRNSGICQQLDELVDTLYGCRPSFSEFDFTTTTIEPFNLASDVGAYLQKCRGMIAEEFTRFWLSGCNLLKDPDFSKMRRGYHLDERTLFRRRGKKRDELTEFDGLYSYANLPVILEAKFQKLNGYGNLDPKNSRLAKRFASGRCVFGTRDLLLLLSFPISPERLETVRQIEAAFPQVRCISPGYSREEVYAAAEKLYSFKLKEALAA